MSDEPTIKINQGEYKALMEIAIAAEQYLRTGASDQADLLRDAVLLTKAFSDDGEVENKIKITISESLSEWLSAEMANVIEYASDYDAERANELIEALKDGSQL